MVVSATQVSGSASYPSPGPHNVSATDINTDNIEITWNTANFGPGLVCNGLDDFSSMSGGGSTGSIPPNTGAGEDPVPGGPTRDYTVQCTDTAGNTSQDTVSLQIPPAPTGTTLNVRLSTDASWPSPAWPESTPFVIDPAGPSDDIHLSWTSAGADSCQDLTSSGSGSFSTDSSSPTDPSNPAANCPASNAPGDPVPCMDTGVTEPDIGDYGVYTVQCSSLGGIGSYSLEIHRPAPAPILNIFEQGTLETATLVDIGTTVDVNWDLNGNDPADCTLTGPNWAGPTPWVEDGTVPIVVRGESEFTLDCSAGVIGPLGIPVNTDHTVTRQVKVTGNLMET